MKEESSSAAARSCRAPSDFSGSPAGLSSGSSAAAAATWQNGVQQSIFAWSAGLAGMWPFIVQPGIAEGAVIALAAAAGLNASATAASTPMKSLITGVRI